MTQTRQAAPMTAPAPAPQTAPAKKSPVNQLNEVLNNGAIKKQFENALQQNASIFMAAVLELFSTDGKLQLCDPTLVVKEALKAAVLRLPINKALGQAFIIAYNNTVTLPDGSKRKQYEPTFQIGYKGLYQLAMRTGQYRIINADVGEIDLDGDRKSETVIGYFAYIELLNGYHKALYMSVEEIAIHAKRYSKAIKGNRDVTVQSLMELSKLPVVADRGSLGWLGNFHGMAIKTVLRNLLSKYGYLSVELQQALDSDDGAATQSVVKAPTADTAGVATAQAVDATTVEYEDITPAPAEVESEEAQVIECGF